MISGKEDQVPSVLDGTTDILLSKEAEEDASAREDSKIEEKRVTGLKLMKLFSKFMWEKGQKPGKELRGAYIPAAKFDALQAKVKADADGETATNSSLSESHILTGWVTHLIAKQEAKPRPFVLTSLFNARDKIPSLKDGGKGGVHLQNMQLMTATLLSDDVPSGSMAAIASEHKRQEEEQTTEKQTLAAARKYKSEVEAGSDAPRIYADSTDSVIVLLFNLFEGDMLTTADFSAAVVDGSASAKTDEAGSHKPGVMVSYFSAPLSWTSTGLDAVYLLGKDHNGGVWVMARLGPETWNLMGEELEAL